MSSNLLRTSLTRTLSRTVDPLRLYLKLTGARQDTALLESRDGNGRNDTQSLLLVGAALRIESRGRTVTLNALSSGGEELLSALTDSFSALAEVNEEQNVLSLTLPAPGEELDEEERLSAPGPADVLRILLNETQASGDAPPLLLPGQFSYDFLETHETLPPAAKDPLNLPDMLFWLPETMVRVDHRDGNLELIVHGYGGNHSAEEALHQLEEAVYQVPEGDLPGQPSRVPNRMPEALEVDLDDDAYADVVRTMKRHIVAGDVFQIVPSRTFRLPCPDAPAAYEQLRSLNPSPYLFYLSGPEHVLFGSSPETCVRVSGTPPRTVNLFPIAGTRPRGRDDEGHLDPDLDNRYEAELKLHSKELAEHMMLVDLARNDVARISVPGTRRVSRLLEIERYSHVMHLVSLVEGELRPQLDSLHAYLATMTMGTLTGAPKVEAAKLLRKYEADKRGAYGGAVGYLSSSGEMDTAIVIRSAVVKGGTAYIRAGAGIVYDSDPLLEAEETRNKANAVIQAIAAADGGGTA